MSLLAKRVDLLDTENAFKIGPQIKAIEDQGKRVIRCNLGRARFSSSLAFIKEEVKRQIDLDNTHYCDPQGILPLRKAIAKHLSDTRGIQGDAGDGSLSFQGPSPLLDCASRPIAIRGMKSSIPARGFRSMSLLSIMWGPNLFRSI